MDKVRIRNQAIAARRAAGRLEQLAVAARDGEGPGLRRDRRAEEWRLTAGVVIAGELAHQLEIAGIGHGEVYIIPATEETTGHGTTGSQATLYADRLAAFLESVPKM